MTDLRQRLLDLAESLESCEWNHPITAVETCKAAAEVIGKLPVTADGVLVVPGGTYYYPDPDGDDDWFPRIATVQAAMVLEDLIYASPGWGDVYSTGEAAEKARAAM